MKRFDNEENVSPDKRFLNFYSDVPTPGKNRKRSFANVEVVGTQQSVNQCTSGVERLDLNVMKDKGKSVEFAGPSAACKGKQIVMDDCESSEADDSDDEDYLHEADIADPEDVFEADVEDLFPVKKDVQMEVAAITSCKSKKPKKEYAKKTKASRNRVSRFQEKESQISFARPVSE